MVDFEVRMRLLEADGRCEESGRDGGGVAGGGRGVVAVMDVRRTREEEKDGKGCLSSMVVSTRRS